MESNQEKEILVKLQITMNNGDIFEATPNINIDGRKEALQWFVKTFVGNNTMVLLEGLEGSQAVPVGEIKKVEAREV